LNGRPPAPQAGALANCATPRTRNRNRHCMVSQAADGLFERHGLNVRVRGAKRGQRVHELHLPSCDLVLDRGPREIAKNEPLLHRVVTYIHEMELKRRLNFKVVTNQSAQDRFTGFDIGSQRHGFDCERMIGRKHHEVVMIATDFHRRGIIGDEPGH
jgi:hypothetical protein